MEIAPEHIQLGKDSFRKNDRVFARWTRREPGDVEPDHWFYPAEIIDVFMDNSGKGFRVKWLRDQEICPFPISPSDIIPAKDVMKAGILLNAIDRKEPAYYHAVELTGKPTNVRAQGIAVDDTSRSDSYRFRDFAIDLEFSQAFLPMNSGPSAQSWVATHVPKNRATSLFGKRELENVRFDPVPKVDVQEVDGFSWLVAVPAALARQWTDSETESVGHVTLSWDEDLQDLTSVFVASEIKSQQLPEYQFTPKRSDYHHVSMTEMLGSGEMLLDSAARTLMDMRPAGGGPAKRVGKAPKRPTMVKLIEVPLISMPSWVNVQSKAIGSSRAKTERRFRLDRKTIQGLLMEAFEEHQYCRVVDLIRYTEQPRQYVTHILKDIGNFHTERNVWELKPEYRHGY